MAGIQEVLTLVLLIVGLIFIPRVFKGPGQSSEKKTGDTFSFSGKIRIGIVLSVAFPVVTAIYFKPWHHNILPFLLTGVLPVAVGWAVLWVYKGFQNPGRKQ